MPAISAWHPSWREELWSSLAREPHATYVHESQTPPFVDQLGVGALPQGELLAPMRRPFVGAVNRTVRGIKSPTAPPQRSLRSGHRRGTTVQIGYVNRNEQEVVLATGFPGTDHGQSVYVLRCGRCGYEYGSNGSDNFQRKCPECQDGAPGLRWSQGADRPACSRWRAAVKLSLPAYPRETRRVTTGFFATDS